MAKYIRSVKLPKSDLVAIDHIVGVKRFDSGVGLLDQRNRMIGWVEVTPSENSEEKFNMVLEIFDMLINDRRRSEQPDWSFLDEDDVAPEVTPTKRNPMKKSSED